MKETLYHDSGMRWVIQQEENGLSVESSMAGFRKLPGMFQQYLHIRFDKLLHAFLTKEAEGYSFSDISLSKEAEKYHYYFCHEALNRMLSIPRDQADPLLQNFLSSISRYCQNVFSHGNVKMN